MYGRNKCREFRDLFICYKLQNVDSDEGKTPTAINIIGLKNEVSSEEFEKIDIFNAAYAKYLERDFVKAGKLFVQANSVKGGDETSLIFAERCKLYLEKGIPENWDGIINLTSKQRGEDFYVKN